MCDAYIYIYICISDMICTTYIPPFLFHSQYFNQPISSDGLPPLLQTLAKGFLVQTKKDPYHTLSQKAMLPFTS